MIATTTVAVLRGSTTDALGDEVEDNSTPLKLYSDWVEAHRNIIPNPSMSLNAGLGWVPATANATAVIANTVGELGQGAKRQTVTSLVENLVSTVALYGARNKVEMPLGVLGELWVLGIRARASRPINAAVTLGYGSGSAALGSLAIPAGVNEVEVSGIFAVTAAAVDQRLNMKLQFQASPTQNPTVVNGDWIEYSRPILVPVPFDPALYFDGSTNPNGELERTRWLGSPDASVSVLETRNVVADYTNLPASITETSRSVFDPSSGEWRTVRYYKGRLPATTPLVAGDRLRDNRTGRIYTIEEDERTPRSISGRSSLSLDLKLTGE